MYNEPVMGCQRCEPSSPRLTWSNTMRCHLGSFCAALLACLAFEPVNAGDKPRAGDAILLPGGGVGDPAGKVGFFPNAVAGIDAVDLAKGEVLWTTKAADRPLIADENRLIAWQIPKGRVSRIYVVVLDATNKGTRVGEPRELSMPIWASYGHEQGASFKTAARLEMDNLLFVWEARRWYAGGAAPTPEIEEEARKHETGAVRMNVKAGTMESFSKDKRPKDLPKIPEGEPASVTLAGRTYGVVEKANPKDLLEIRRTLQAKDASGALLWQRELAPRPNLLAVP